MPATPNGRAGNTDLHGLKFLNRSQMRHNSSENKVSIHLSSQNRTRSFESKRAAICLKFIFKKALSNLEVKFQEQRKKTARRWCTCLSIHCHLNSLYLSPMPAPFHAGRCAVQSWNAGNYWYTIKDYWRTWQNQIDFFKYS